jgi:hypothetical protein
MAGEPERAGGSADAALPAAAAPLPCQKLSHRETVLDSRRLPDLGDAFRPPPPELTKAAIARSISRSAHRQTFAHIEHLHAGMRAGECEQLGGVAPLGAGFSFCAIVFDCAAVIGRAGGQSILRAECGAMADDNGPGWEEGNAEWSDDRIRCRSFCARGRRRRTSSASR